ncbi:MULTISPECIES: GntR family transcriptional regulator [Agrobacterium]|uniref:GntR family transcriptional regulator n=1 Tax=Agrobacterium TaxID=357 RepID=UPI000DBF568C|nr:MULTISPECIES: GntR family transcriptional regulator [Agrobacterium]MDH0873871.1 GntR family transcriptional regulator [Agrobacterium pusense]MDH1271494.1 GntR family transcriptional regulator [Agrobacterium pusense]RAL99441.1 GntR family transcriptional regulator [Agrobacterium sp. MS2]HAU74905.1 GntR family transcriptional regulator [Agrobacterium sp.]
MNADKQTAPLQRDETLDDATSGSPSTLHDNLLTGLRAMFMASELPDGSRIPEAELCQRFGVSRTPLREALKVMAAEGFVILRPNRGAIVAPIDPEEVGPLFEFKGALERLIGLTAAERATDEEIVALEAIHLQLNEALSAGRHDEYTHLNYKFHRGLAQATRNLLLIQNYETVQQKIWRYRFLVNEHDRRLQQSFAEHERILTALKARTPLDLAERLESHSRLTGEAMLAVVASRKLETASATAKKRRTGARRSPNPIETEQA